MKVCNITCDTSNTDIVFQLEFGCSHCDNGRVLEKDRDKFCPNCGEKLNKPRIKDKLTNDELVKCINIATGIVKT